MPICRIPDFTCSRFLYIQAPADVEHPGGRRRPSLGDCDRRYASRGKRASNSRKILTIRLRTDPGTASGDVYLVDDAAESLVFAPVCILLTGPMEHGCGFLGGGFGRRRPSEAVRWRRSACLDHLASS